MKEKIKLGVLGGTGMAGREAILHHNILKDNYAKITVVTGSNSSAGNSLGDIFHKKEKELEDKYNFWNARKCPKELKNLQVSKTNPEIIAKKADYVISALPSSIAKQTEPQLRDKGVHVFSNASKFRWKNDIPLMVPEVSFKEIKKTKTQNKKGIQVNNPNCTTAGFVPIVHSLKEFGYQIEHLKLITMQSISGKGDTVASRDYADNLHGSIIEDWSEGEVPNGEEIKSEIEPQKILGINKNKKEVSNEYKEYRNKRKAENIIPISSQTNRVKTQFGHLETLFITFKREVGIDGIQEKIEDWNIPDPVKDLPSSPNEMFQIKEGINLKEDAFFENGMGLTLSRFRQINPKTICLQSLSHNLRRGATWTARQCLELYLQEIENKDF